MKLRRIIGKLWPFVTKKFFYLELKRNDDFWRDKYRPLDEQAVSKILVTNQPEVRLFGPYGGNEVGVELQHFCNRQIIDWDFWVAGNNLVMIRHFVNSMSEKTEKMLVKHLCESKKGAIVELQL